MDGSRQPADGPPAEKPLNYWVAVADRAEHRNRRLEALERATERAGQLEAIVQKHAPQARQIDAERQGIEGARREAKTARALFQENLQRIYRDPKAAEQAWAQSCKSKGLKRTMREVGRDPALLGQLRGWRVMLFANIERKEAERIATSLPSVGAEARVTAAKAATMAARSQTLDRAKLSPEMREYHRAQQELGGRSSFEFKLRASRERTPEKPRPRDRGGRGGRE